MNNSESILRSLQQPILLLDDTFHPIIANPAFFQLFEIAQTELEGEFIHDFIYGKNCEPNLHEVVKTIITNNSNGGSQEVLCTLPTGKRISLSINACQVIENGSPKNILVELSDITQKIETETKINELNQSLQHHVQTLDEVNKELESYSHSVSHDLRTPLRFVNRVAHKMLHDSGTELSDDFVQQIQMILQATTEMGNLIENLLVFSQVNREPLKKRTINLRNLFSEVIRELEYAKDQRDIEYVVLDIPSCRGDRTLIKVVASNLLVNSIKFSHPDKKNKITIGYKKVNDETVYYVEDNGIGFNTENSNSIFLPFHKIHKSSEYEGSGIGLALVKRIIERHGGRTWAEGEINKGATIYFTLGKH